MTDQFEHWRHAVAGNHMDTEKGNPRSGYYRNLAKTRDGESRIEAVCIYRDDDARLQCIRDVIGNGDWMSDAQIDEFFGSICMYPISEELYLAITERGEAWPPEYGAGGRLTAKDQTAGVVWTPAYGRKRLGLEVAAGEGPQPATLAPAKPAEKPAKAPSPKPSEPMTVDETLAKVASVLGKDEARAYTAPAKDAAENPRAVIGGNRPPIDEEIVLPETERTPEQDVLARVNALANRLKAWLDSVGGKPRNKAEADYVGDHAAAFKKLLDEAESSREREKKPHLDAGREIDAKWKPAKEKAEEFRKGVKVTAKNWLDAENARIAAEHAAAAKAAAEANPGSPDPVASSEPEFVRGVGNAKTLAVRKATTWKVTNYRVFLASIVGREGDLPFEINEALDKVAKRRAEDAPGVEKEITESMQ